MLHSTYLGGGEVVSRFTLDKCEFKLLRDFAVEEFFFLRVASRKKGRKIKYRQATYYKICLWIFFVLQVAQIKKAKDFFANELHTRASTRKQGSRWVGQGWSIATRRGREKGKKKKAKEGGLSPQEGDVKKIRKEKKKTKESGLSPQEGDVRKRTKEKKKTM